MDSYALLSRLITKVKTSRPENDTDLITKAFAFAESAHEHQKRRSGEPYIIHPVESAVILSDLKMDTATIAA
ncbi:MAG TPA: HD domain-containing protein, partial [Spirochaetota bacterium]|nr:HD domain-containing protein [Spirochaetota bacterium]